jgi:hypothetical protein
LVVKKNPDTKRFPTHPKLQVKLSVFTTSLSEQLRGNNYLGTSAIDAINRIDAINWIDATDLMFSLLVRGSNQELVSRNALSSHLTAEVLL